MAEKISQADVNKKCELIKSQFEEITIDKIRKLIGREVSILDLAEKVTLFKENPKKAYKVASNDSEVTSLAKDELLDLLQLSLQKYSINDKDLAIYLRSELNNIIESKVDYQVRKYKDRAVFYSNKNDSLDMSNLTLEKRYKELLEKFNALKEESYGLKQSVQTRAIKDFEQENLEKSLLAWDEFKTAEEQLKNLSTRYRKIAVYDKSGRIIIKFPATEHLTQECRTGSSKYLQAKTEYHFKSQSWVLSNFPNISKTLDFLKRNRFVFSKELETVGYHYKNSKK